MKIEVDFSLMPCPNVMGEFLRSQLFDYSLCSDSSIDEKFIGGERFKLIETGTIFERVSDLVIESQDRFDEDEYGYTYEDLRTRLKVYSDGQIHVGWVQIKIDNINVIGIVVGDESVRTKMKTNDDNYDFEDHVEPFIWQ